MTTSPATDVPDLTLFHVIHRGLRADAHRLADAVATLRPGDGRRARALARWYAHYRAEVHEHHQTEDTIFFPALLEKVPTCDRHRVRVEVDHDRLTEVVDTLATSLDRLAAETDDARWATVHAEAARTAVALDQLMSTHLDFEDADVLPVYLRHFGADEYDELGERALKQAPSKELPFIIPWVMSHAETSEQRTLLAGAPFAFQVLWYATRRRHARTTAAALGAGTGEVR